MTDPAGVETRGLSKAYAGTLVLDDVSIAFPAGRVSALIGRNGAGKSTLVKILAGAVRPDAGEIRLEGGPVALRSPANAIKRGIATVHQELSLIGGLTVAENILFGRLPRKPSPLSAVVDWPRVFEIADALLRSLGVRLEATETVSSLGFAQRQMVEIARAMSFAPVAVLLDEPTSGLGRSEALRLFGLIRALVGRGVAVVYVTHRLGELPEIADTVTALRDGRKVATIPISEATPGTLAAMMFGRISAAPLEATPAAGHAPVMEVRDLGLDGALHGIGFSLFPGEILGIAGMLGSGRSELLMSLFGAIRADRGEIRVEGRVVSKVTPARMKRRGVALVPEDRRLQALVLPMSVLDNACLASLQSLPRAAGTRPVRRGLIWRRLQRRAVEPIVRTLQLAAGDLDSPVSTLSGGNQQKTVVARWLATSPAVVLLDEPTRGIDIEAKTQIFRIIRDLARSGVASIFVSSELEEVLEISHRILVMKGGRIVAESRPAGLSLERLMTMCVEGRGAEPAA